MYKKSVHSDNVELQKRTQYSEIQKYTEAKYRKTARREKSESAMYQRTTDIKLLLLIFNILVLIQFYIAIHVI
jgi:hypothetical protein